MELGERTTFIIIFLTTGNFICSYLSALASVGSSHGSTPERQSSNGIGETKNLAGIANVISTSDSEKSDSWDTVNVVGGDMPGGELGIIPPSTVSPVSSSNLTNLTYGTESGASVTNLDIYGNPGNITTDSSTVQFRTQFGANPPGYYSRRSYPHIVPALPQTNLTQFQQPGTVIQSPGGNTVSDWYTSTATAEPAAGTYQMVQSVQYPNSNSPAKTTTDTAQTGALPGMSTLRQTATGAYNNPYGTYEGVIQTGQPGFSNTFQQAFNTYCTTSTASTTTQAVYSGQQSAQTLFPYVGYPRNPAQTTGYTYTYLGAPPPAYSSRAYVSQMNATPPPNAVANYSLAQLVPSQATQAIPGDNPGKKFCLQLEPGSNEIESIKLGFHEQCKGTIARALILSLKWPKVKAAT